jgi:hypothetical protein
MCLKQGKQTYTSDALLRACITNQCDAVDDCCIEQLATVDIELASSLKLVAAPETIQQIQQAAETDETYCLLRDVTRASWPHFKKELPASNRIYHSIRDELVTSDNLIYNGDPIVIPPSLKDLILKKNYTDRTKEKQQLYALRMIFCLCTMSDERVATSRDKNPVSMYFAAVVPFIVATRAPTPLAHDHEVMGPRNSG